MTLLHHLALAVTDPDRASQFLCRWFQFATISTLWQPCGLPIHLLRQAEGGLRVELIGRREVDASPAIHLAFSTPDPEGVARCIAEAEGEVVEEPLRIGSETICFIRLPPDGWLIELNDRLPD